MPWPLLALAIASFGIGTTEFVIMGLLPDVAADLGVSIPTAGLLVTGYALGVVVGGPILAIATARLPRKPALLALMGIFVAGNALCALAPTYGLLMTARVATAFCHGAFFGIGAVVAADLVESHRRASAMALMFAGLTLANVLGVPFGTALGQALGWRATFWAVAAIGIVAAAAIALLLPRLPAAPAASLMREFRVLRRPALLIAMTISTLASVSLFSVFTYITPILEQVSGFAPADVTWILLLFGVGLTLGNVLGGFLGDRRPGLAISLPLAALTLVLVVFAYTSRFPIPAIVTMPVWGILVFALVSPLQMRVVSAALDGPNLASTLNQSAFNLGNAAGAWLGGAVVTLGGGYAWLPLVGASVALAALVLTVSTDRGIGRRSPTRAFTPAPSYSAGSTPS